MRIELTKEYLFEEYIIKEKTSREIAKETKYSSRYIRYKLEEYNLIRNRKDSKLIKKEEYNVFLSSLNFYIPKKRLERYMYYSYFYNNNNTINRLINELSSIKNYNICKKEVNSDIEEKIFFIKEIIEDIAREYFIFGDVFLYRNKHNNSLEILNPNNVRIDENFINIIFDSYYVASENKYLNNLEKNEKILDKDQMIHIKRNGLPYLRYGESLINSHLPSLIFNKLALEKHLFKNENIDKDIFEQIEYSKEEKESEICKFKKDLQYCINNSGYLDNYNIF